MMTCDKFRNLAELYGAFDIYIPEGLNSGEAYFQTAHMADIFATRCDEEGVSVEKLSRPDRTTVRIAPLS